MVRRMAENTFNPLLLPILFLLSVQDNANPQWQATEISSGKLCNGDWNRSLKFEVFDYDYDGNHDYIGEFQTTLEEVGLGDVLCYRDY